MKTFSSSLQSPFIPKPNPTKSYGSINAETAYFNRDSELSRQIHCEEEKKEIETYHNVLGSELVKSIIFGGLDGIITGFSIVSSGYASHLSSRYIIVLGFANVLADAISMGHGDYFSEKTELEFVNDQYKREKWEMENYPEGEIKEMVQLYNSKYNISPDEASQLLVQMTKYPKLFVDHMMVLELGLLPPEDTDFWLPVKKGFATFLSFVLFGSIPLIVFSFSENFWYSLYSCLITLAFLGWVRSYFTKTSRLYNGIITVINGSLSASVAFLVGYGLDKLL